MLEKVQNNYSKQLKEIGCRIDIIEYLSSRRFLSDLYAELKKELKPFSYRKYSQIMGFGETNYLHLLCKGQRALSKKAALMIAKSLGLNKQRTDYLIKLALYESARKPIEKDRLFSELVELAKSSLSSELSQDEMKYFSEWYHAVIRECVGLPNFSGNVKDITKLLISKVNPEEIQKSLKLLEQIGYIEYDQLKGSYFQTKNQIRTPKEIKGLAVSRYHQHMINQGRDSIMAVKAKRRDISAVTVRINKKFAEEIKFEIQKFRTDILRKAEKCTDGDQIYQMNIQWFPFTKGDDDD